MLDRFNEAELDFYPVEHSDDGAQWMHCRLCENRIAPVASSSELGGRHVHRRINPSGFLFEFAIYTLAPGCNVIGSPLEQDSWFSGYSWQIAVCNRCTEHLGWRFAGPESSSIYGLICTKLLALGDS